MYRKEAVSQSLNALLEGKVEEAVAVSSNYFGGAGILYEKETIAVIRRILEHDYTPDPAIKDKVLQPLRVVAAATELWGAGELQEFADVSGDWTYKLEPQVVIDLLYAAGLQRDRLDHLRDAGVVEVTVRSRREMPAPACRGVVGMRFPIDEAPPLPHGDPDCRCSYAPAPKEVPANESGS